MGEAGRAISAVVGGEEFIRFGGEAAQVSHSIHSSATLDQVRRVHR
jgi:hypothetical protein